MPNQEPEAGDEIIGDSIPGVPEKQRVIRPDLSEPWYRPAKQFLRRQQWNACILHLLNRLGNPSGPKAPPLKYVGLPGQHYFDVLSVGGICVTKDVRLDYLGFRTGLGPDAQAVRLAELSILSKSTYFTQNSMTYPDSIENIGRPDTVASTTFNDRGPFDIINLDVCGGILHDNTTPLLNAIRYVLTSQAAREQPWLLFVTTAAICSHIADEVVQKFFSSITSNCERVASFQEELASAAGRHGLTVEQLTEDPAALDQMGFVRFFSLAFGKWLLASLGSSTPPASLSLHSVYCFRNTDRPEPEMLSFAYAITPLDVGGVDPSGLTGPATPHDRPEYVECAISLIANSIDGMKDLDKVWDDEPGLKAAAVSECERLFGIIGVDAEGIREWKARHAL